MSLCVQLSLQGVAVPVIGGGRIAYRKCCQLEQEGVELVVIAKQSDACFQGVACPYIIGSYRPQQLQGKMPVLACYDDLINNRQTCEDAKQVGTLTMSIRQNCGASMHAPAVEETAGYMLAAGIKGASPLLARQMLKEMDAAMKENYASRIVMLCKLCQYVLQHTRREERPQLLSRLVRLSQCDSYCIKQALQGKGLQLIYFHGVEGGASQEPKNFCAVIEYRKTNLAAAATFLSGGISDTSARPVAQWLQIVKSLHTPVTLVPMLFQNGRYHSRLLSIKSENVRVKPLMFQERSEVWQCLQEVRRENGCANLLVIYHSCIDGAFSELLQGLMKEDVYFHAVYEKQVMDCILPQREESVAILPMYILRGSHYRKDSDGGSALIQSLQKRNCSVHVLQASYIELRAFQEFIIQKME